ncbi:MAG: sulfite exporter TauE/SafE family protein [Anaerolineae bacterium]|jgi:hypothetical protein
MAPTDVSILLMAGVIVFAGHVVKGATGFGSALFAVPLLLLILDIRFVAPLFMLFDIIGGFIMVGSSWRSVDQRLLLLVLAGMLLGTGIGTWVLLTVSHQILKRVLGILVTSWAVARLLQGESGGGPKRGRLGNSLAPASGFVGGLLGAMFSVSGPPIIIYLSHVLHDKGAFRATLFGIFFVEACYKLVFFSAGQLINRQVLLFALLLAPFVLAGVIAGSRLQRRVDQRLFKRVVAAILAAAGLLLIFSP